jgi:hypothetical protein
MRGQAEQAAAPEAELEAELGAELEAELGAELEAQLGWPSCSQGGQADMTDDPAAAAEAVIAAARAVVAVLRRDRRRAERLQRLAVEARDAGADHARIRRDAARVQAEVVDYGDSLLELEAALAACDRARGGR